MEFAFNRPLTADNSYQISNLEPSACSLCRLESLSVGFPGRYSWREFPLFHKPHHHQVQRTAFPYGTLFINITGSLVLGFFLVWTTERVFADPKWRLLVASAFAAPTPHFPAMPLRPCLILSRATGRCLHPTFLPTMCFAWALFCWAAMVARAIKFL